MSNKNLVILGLAAAVMLFCAVSVSLVANKAGSASNVVSTYLIQGLDPGLINSITMQAGKETTTLNRQGNSFVVAGKDNYPAASNKINQLITGILDIKTHQLVTKNPANHTDLEVAEQKAQSVVKFFDKDNKPITGIIVGKRDTSGDSYVRSAFSDDVYLCGDIPQISSSPMEYIEQQLITVNNDDIVSAIVSEPNGTYMLQTDPNSREITLVNMPADKKFKAADYKQIGRAHV